MSKNLTYDNAQRFIKDKDTAVAVFIESSLDKTQGIFVYENLPDTLPACELENILQRTGHCIVAEVDGNIYALKGGFSGENDVYDNPRFYTVSNVALKLTKTFELGVDCILFKNDYKHMGLMPILEKYAVLLTDAEISLNTAAVLSRITMLISAPDDRTKASADLFMTRILNGDFSVIGDSPFFEGVKMQTSDGRANHINQLIELVQYYKATFLNEIGLNANFNMKRERLTENEVAMNIDNLLPFIENMYTERKRAVDAINEKYNLNIVVDYNGVWKTNHEHAEKEMMLVSNDGIEGDTTETNAFNSDVETVDTTEVNDVVETADTTEMDEANDKEENEKK